MPRTATPARKHGWVLLPSGENRRENRGYSAKKLKGLPGAACVPLGVYSCAFALPLLLRQLSNVRHNAARIAQPAVATKDPLLDARVGYLASGTPNVRSSKQPAGLPSDWVSTRNERLFCNRFLVLNLR